MLQVVKRSLQPVWKEDWSAVVEDAMDQTLDLDMWDKDHVGADEFMGRATIPLSKLTDNGKSDQWVRIVELALRPTSYPGGLRRGDFRSGADPVSLDADCSSKRGNTNSSPGSKWI